jgi:hypothetical protein
MYERRRTDMKEKYIKPEINIMMSIVVGGDENNENGNIVIGADNGNIGGDKVSGEDDGDW